MSEVKRCSNGETIVDIGAVDNAHPITPERLPDLRGYNGGGGGNMNNNSNDDGSMGNKNYVTHKEFDDAMHHIDIHFEKLNTQLERQFGNMNTKFEKINTKFANQKVWFYGTAISIIVAVCTILSLVIALKK